MKKFILYSLLILTILSVNYCATNRDNPSGITKSPAFKKISDDSLLTLVQYKTFQYFWEGAEPVSGMARERYHVNDIYPENDKNVITSGGSGFGVMAILVGIERKFISREEGIKRFEKIVSFLENSERFHGAWSHWLYGETGKAKPFSSIDDGADIVETAYLMQGLLTVRQYFKDGTEEEKNLAKKIDKLWKEVDWKWFTKDNENVLYWHWSPVHNWEMNFPVKGYNECLILYVMAASSSSSGISPEVYYSGWAGNGGIVSNTEAFGIPLIVNHIGAEMYGGPLFWSHYSFLGLDPKGLRDRYVDYWKVNVNQALINYKWCSMNPKHFKGYSENRWGLTASYSIQGYAAHSPGEKTDLGVISPTAALSSFPYTPSESMAALKDFYYNLGDKIFGKYGFYDAFSDQYGWYPQRYLAIDQGPVIVMIENFRSELLWKLFMSCPEVQNGLRKLEFSSPLI